MKKLLLTAVAAVSLGLSAKAAVNVGDVAPNFTLTDINGVSHELYKYLDSGYTVIIDVSAAWCGPCWQVHQSHVFENLTDHYGPNGTVSAKKIKVIFIEGEGTNTLAQIQGTTTSQTYAGFTQGDWTAGTNYPIIDNTTQNSTYLYGGFPSFTVICRDRLVTYKTAGYSSAMFQESFWLKFANQDCPQTGPSATVDAKAVTYTGPDYFMCSSNPIKVEFQNYSTTQTISSATVKLMSGSNVISTQNWTGSLAPYQKGNVTFPGFTPTASQTGPYNFEVTVNGDSQPSNNVKTNIVQIQGQSNATAVPYTQNLDALTTDPSNFYNDGSAFGFIDGTGSPSVIGASGQPTKAYYVAYYGMQAGTTGELVLGNYNNGGATASSFEFDVAYAQYAGTENDKLELMVSKDCGATWTTAYSKAGAQLMTHAPVGNNTEFIPQAAGDWRHETVQLPVKSSNLFIKFKATSAYGNYAWIDNFKINGAVGTAVNDVIAENSIQLYPNPTTQDANVQFNLIKSTNVSIQVIDMLGRVVVNISKESLNSGVHTIAIPTSNMNAGIYNVKIQTEAGSHTERLTVVK